NRCGLTSCAGAYPVRKSTFSFPGYALALRIVAYPTEHPPMNDRLCRRLSVAATAAFLLVGLAIFFLSHYRTDDDEVLLHYTSHHICDPAVATRMNDMLIDLIDKSRGATDERTFDKSSRKAAIRIAVEGNYPLPSLVYCLVAKAPVHGGDQDF